MLVELSFIDYQREGLEGGKVKKVGEAVDGLGGSGEGKRRAGRVEVD